MKICYFGNFNPELSRNKIYGRGLRENGVEIIECRDGSRGLSKFRKLYAKHRIMKDDYDVLVVGYPGHSMVSFAKMISRKPVVFDALCTSWEAEALSHGVPLWRSVKAQIVDFLAVKFADIILVETEHQRKFFEKRFGKSDKYKVVYTGVDDSLFFREGTKDTFSLFTVLFRGRLSPEAGVKHVVHAAEILKDHDIFWKILGFGMMEKEVRQQLEKMNLPKVELITKELSFSELRKQMCSCDVSLGQFEDNERLQRTIPHKAFESLAMELPYVTARAIAVSELFTDGETCLFVNPADPEDLANKIQLLRNDPLFTKKLAEKGRELYEKKLTPKILAANILKYIHEYNKRMEE